MTFGRLPRGRLPGGSGRLPGGSGRLPGGDGRLGLLAGGGGRAFDPTSVAGLALWLKAGDFALADGASISTDWPDASGNSRNATPTGSPVFRASVINGKPGVEFNNASRKFVTPSFLSSAYNTAFSHYAVWKRPATNLVVWASNGGITYYAGANAGDVVNTNNLSDTQVSYPRSSDEGCLVSFRYDGSQKKAGNFNSDSRSIIEAATGNLGLSGALTIGQLSSGGSGWDGQILELLIFNAALSDADDLYIIRGLSQKYGFDWSSRARIFFDGNSLTAGVGSTGGNTYPAQCLALLGADYEGENLGVGGETTAQRAEDALTGIDQKYSGYRADNIAVLWEVTNDLHVNEDPAAALTRYADWCQDRRDAGFKVLAMTVLPRGDSYVDFETDRQTCNTSIRANWASYADALVDVAADELLGDDGNLNDDIIYADDAHLTNAGYAIVAGLVRDAILTL